MYPCEEKIGVCVIDYIVARQERREKGERWVGRWKFSACRKGWGDLDGFEESKFEICNWDCNHWEGDGYIELLGTS